jgi:hypothetical protein
MYGGMEVWFHEFLTLALDGGEWSASRPDRFTPRKEPLVPIGEEAGWGPGPYKVGNFVTSYVTTSFSRLVKFGKLLT